MKLKGYYSEYVSYSLGDVVVYENYAYILQYPQIAGRSPVDTICWGRLNQPLAEAVMLIMDGIGIANDNAAARTQEEIERFFINDQTLILKAGEGADEKSYAVTVDASGDTPEIAVEEIVEESEEEAET